MKVAIYSDIHDNFYNLRLALEIIKQKDIRHAICLGDFINPGIVREIITHGIKTFAVWGNNDGEKPAITKLSCASNGIFEIADTTFSDFEIDGKPVFLTHHPDFALPLARSGDFKAIFYGHDHVAFSEKLPNGCLLANPGEISSHKTNSCTFMIWDTETNEVETLAVEGFMNVNN